MGGESKSLCSLALVALVVLASACAPKKTGAADGQSDSLNAGPRAEAVPTPKDGQRNHELEQPSLKVLSPVKVGAEAQKTRSADPAGDTPHGARAQRARPWAHNTGPSDPEALVPSGSLTIKTDGAVVENVDITGLVRIRADRVELRNFRIDATGTFYGIKIDGGHSGIVLEDGEIHGMDSAGILGAGFTGRRLHIHDSSGDGLKIGGEGGPTVVEYSFIEKLGRKVDSHADGNQTRGGSHITFRYNNIYMPYPGTPKYPGKPYKSNATFMLQLQISDFVIENNWLTGGNYTIYCPDDGGVSVRNNIFGRYNGGWSDGKAGLRVRTGTCDQWSGNRWEDSGGPI